MKQSGYFYEELYRYLNTYVNTCIHTYVRTIHIQNLQPFDKVRAKNQALCRKKKCNVLTSIALIKKNHNLSLYINFYFVGIKLSPILLFATML